MPSTFSYVSRWRVAWKVSSAVHTSPGPAACSRRLARFTTLPITVYSRTRPEPIAPAITTPVVTPARPNRSTPLEAPTRSTARRLASAATTAR